MAANPADLPAPLHPKHPYAEEGSEYIPETCAHGDNRPLVCKTCALIGIRYLLTWASSLRTGDVPPPICNVCEQPFLHELVCEKCLPQRGFVRTDSALSSSSRAPETT